MSVPTTGWTARNGILWNDYLAPERLGVQIIDSATLNLRTLTQRLTPATSYTLIATLRTGLGLYERTAVSGGNATSFGLCLTDGTKYITFDIVNQSAANGGTNRLRVQRFTTVNAAGATMAGPTIDLETMFLTLKIAQDATHRTFSYWTAGAWVQFYQEAAQAFVTETAVGFGGVSHLGNIAQLAAVELLDWDLRAIPPVESDLEDPCRIATPLYIAALQPSAALGDTLIGGQTEHRDPPEYYGGRKPATVLSIGAITRAASDYLTGSFPAQSASVVWADTTRQVRQIFGSVRADFTSSPLWIYLTSRANRRARGIPRLLFYGFLSDDPISQDLTYTTNANDLVGRDYSLLSDEVLVPKQTIRLDEFPNCPKETLGGGVPIIGGTVSNADLALDDASIAGAIKLIDLGDFDCQDGVTRRALLVAGHACKSVTLFQGGDEIPSGDYGLNAWAPGQTGWTNIVPSGEPYVTINDRWFTLVFVSGKRAKAIDAGTGSETVATVASGATNVAFDVGAGETAQFAAGDEIDIRLAANGDEPELRSIDTIVGVTITVTEALSSVPANGDTVRPSSLVLEDGADGFVYADVEGMTDDAHGAGTVMEDLLLLDRHLIENFIFGDYSAGPWLDTPTFEFFPGGVVSDLLDRESWDTASDVGAGYNSGTPFKGSFVLGAGGRRQSTRQVMADLARSSNILRGWRGNNQLCVRMLDRDRANFLGGRTPITDRKHILSQPRLAPTPMKDWLCNDLWYQYRANYRDDGHGDWWFTGNHGNAPSGDTYGVKTKTESYPMVADADTAATVSQQRIDLLANLPKVWTWGESLCGLKHDVLDGIEVRHYGTSSRGASNAMWIIKQTINPKTSSLVYAAIEVEGLMDA